MLPKSFEWEENRKLLKRLLSLARQAFDPGLKDALPFSFQS
jgi:hypothetical protein